jgi:NarL family two-component system response regulator LiaR
MTKKVIIADDHALIRMGLSAFIDKNKEYDIIATATNGRECIEQFANNFFDLAILDIDMPELNGVEAARWIKENSPHTQIMFITSHASVHDFYQALQLHVSAFLFKENALDEIETALNRITAGQTYISPVCNNYLSQQKELIDRIKDIEKKIAHLSEKEIEVLKLVMERKTTHEIADILCNSYKTIENHRSNICRKIEIQGNNNLLMFALDNKDIIRMFC